MEHHNDSRTKILCKMVTNRPHTQIITGCWNGYTIVDTGSSINLISSKNLRLSGQSQEKVINYDDTPELTAHNNTGIDLVGSIFLDIKIGPDAIEIKNVKFYISSETLQTVLGGEFLKMHNSDVSYRENDDYGYVFLDLNKDEEEENKLMDVDEQYVTSAITLMDTESTPHRPTIAWIGSNDETNNLNGRKLFISEHPLIDDGVVEFVNGVSTLLINNDTDRHILIKREQKIGSIVELNDAIEMVDLNQPIGLLATKHEIRTEKMSVCICKLGGKTDTSPVSVFFMVNNYFTHFRHYDLLEESGPNSKVKPITIKGTSVYVNLTHDINFGMVKQMLSEFDLQQRPIHCFVDELPKAGLKHYEFMGMLTQLSNKVHLRYFKEGYIHNALCPEHDRIRMGNCTVARIMLLNDYSSEIMIPTNGNHVMYGNQTLEFHGVKVQCVKIDLEHHFYIHLNKKGEIDADKLDKVVVSLFNEISSNFVNGTSPWIFIEATKKPEVELTRILDTFLKVKLPYSKLKTQIYMENTFKGPKQPLILPKCNCIHCHTAKKKKEPKSSNHTKISIGQLIYDAKKAEKKQAKYIQSFQHRFL